MKIQEKLTEIAERLESTVNTTNEVGLLTRQMGMVIFFFHYARYLKRDYYEDLGFNLIDSIGNYINVKTPADYTAGLAGIGAGIEYLIQNDFISQESNEYLDEFDDAIFFSLLHSENLDNSLEYGLCGIVKYFHFRTRKYLLKENDISVLLNQKNLIFLVDLIDYQKQITDSYKENILFFLQDVYDKNLLNFKVENLIKYYMKDYSILLDEHIEKISAYRNLKKQEWLQFTQNRLFHTVNTDNNGIMDGYAGYGLSLLSCLDAHIIHG